MEGLAQYGDSDSDHEQHNDSAVTADVPGESNEMLLARHGIVIFC